MTSGNGPESSLSKGVHLIGQDQVPVDARRTGVNNETAPGELTYFLRVKPDRRRAKAVYPPHLERRRANFS
jgi:hypothetical protein